MSRPTKANGQVSYREIAATLCSEIRAGAVDPGSLLPTERELQERFHVTRSVVRRALAEVVDTGWGEAIPNKGVVAMVGPVHSRTRNVAFVDHRSSFNRQLFVSLSVRLQAKGWHLVLVDSQDYGVEGALEYANERCFAAAFIWSKKGYADAARVQSASASMPVLALDHSLKTVATDLVADDNYGGAFEAVSLLAKNGRRQIGVTGFFDMSEANHERFGGYLDALFHAGLQPKPRDFLFIYTSALTAPDTLALDRRLRDPDRPDALFVLQDELVPHVAAAIEGAGLRVPDDVALVAFRDDVVPSFGQTALTTVSVDWEAYADLCVDRLIQRLERPWMPPETYRLPTHLNVRGSCGSPPESWTRPSVAAQTAGTQLAST